MVWAPTRSLKECESKIGCFGHNVSEYVAGDAILCAPGMPHEIETRVVDGKVQRVYKNLWPSLRDFWTWAASEFSDSTYIVFGKERLTFGRVYELSVQAAHILRDVYNVRKGDRVAICSRNMPEYLCAWWGCHLIGAVTVLVNA